MRKVSTSLLVLSSILCLSVSVAAQSTPTRPDVRSLLSQLDIESDRNNHFATLFHIGDKHIEDLIRALDDPDPHVSSNAQVVIRYLGNQTGMHALTEHYKKSGGIHIVGPVPLPLTEWDYDFINSTYLNKPKNFGELTIQYLYALSLDGSPKAKELLPKLIETARAAGMDDFLVKAISSTGSDYNLSSSDDNLANAVLKSSKFLRPADKQHGSAKVIAFNSAQDKALLEIYIDNGVLAEETYHVVVSKDRDGWKLFSISLIAVS
jgi:hypothetical protein